MNPFFPSLQRPLVLASQSPRRAELLRRQQLDFDIVPANIEEKRVEGEAVDHYVTRLARDKALAIGKQRRDALCIGADTIVVLDGNVLEKPDGNVDAVAMLRRLSGRRHSVLSAVALVCHELDFLAAQAQRTEVQFRDLSTVEIERYVSTGEPMDKAGSYGIQDYGALLVEEIEGDYFSVMGLPLVTLHELWLEFLARDSAPR